MKASYLKPLLPLRDIVIFPSMVVPLFVGREKSIKALQETMKTDKSIVLITQKNIFYIIIILTFFLLNLFRYLKRNHLYLFFHFLKYINHVVYCLNIQKLYLYFYLFECLFFLLIFLYDYMEFENLRIYPSTQIVKYNGEKIDLGPKEFKILSLLMERPEQIFSRTQILDKVWGHGIDIEQRTIDVHIRRIRKALMINSNEFKNIIRTVRGSGYALGTNKFGFH